MKRGFASPPESLMHPHHRHHRAERPHGDDDPPKTDGGPATETGPGVDTGICALCDVVNDLFVAPRTFVQNWRLAGEGE